MLLLVVEEQKTAVVKLVVLQLDLDLVGQTGALPLDLDLVGQTVVLPLDFDLVGQTVVETHQNFCHQELHSNNSPHGMELNINNLLDYLDSYNTKVND
jgi:hypothetical protein